MLLACRPGPTARPPIVDHSASSPRQRCSLRSPTHTPHHPPSPATTHTRYPTDVNHRRRYSWKPPYISHLSCPFYVFRSPLESASILRPLVPSTRDQSRNVHSTASQIFICQLVMPHTSKFQGQSKVCTEFHHRDDFFTIFTRNVFATSPRCPKNIKNTSRRDVTDLLLRRVFQTFF